jgi:hypothetical protein
MKKDYLPIDPTWMQKTGGFAKDMTLREWYAGLAMQGLISHIIKDKSFNEDAAELAYHIADAMLKAREAK